MYMNTLSRGLNVELSRRVRTQVEVPTLQNHIRNPHEAQNCLNLELFSQLFDPNIQTLTKQLPYCLLLLSFFVEVNTYCSAGIPVSPISETPRQTGPGARDDPSPGARDDPSPVCAGDRHFL
ncbi:hypothetical protein ElyMa_003511700 [Elysia marginata]|uniref:Uncharacterized protein n=1 Tax=Elysia marginata TaxID=1093978 RepID=A0AAV4EGJ2_9GAST|nr:hypothetical protein ElyMa_003511700 [Elysia marginata]